MPVTWSLINTAQASLSLRSASNVANETVYQSRLGGELQARLFAMHLRRRIVEPYHSSGSSPGSPPTPASSWCVVPDSGHGHMRRSLCPSLGAQAAVLRIQIYIRARAGWSKPGLENRARSSPLCTPYVPT